MNVPDHETVKQIMDATYNKFYLKWRNELTQSNSDQMISEVKEINAKFPYELCRANLLGFIDCIEEQHRRRQLDP